MQKYAMEGYDKMKGQCTIVGAANFKQGISDQAKFRNFLRARGYTVIDYDSLGAHFEGADFLVKKEGIDEPFQIEFKSEAGAKDGIPYSTVNVAYELDGKKSLWRKGDQSRKLFVKLNRHDQHYYVAFAEKLEEKVAEYLSNPVEKSTRARTLYAEKTLKIDLADEVWIWRWPAK